METNEPASKTLTHFDKQGNALMVDVSQKADTVREAVACGTIQVNEAVYQAVEAGTVKKGAGAIDRCRACKKAVWCCRRLYGGGDSRKC